MAAAAAPGLAGLARLLRALALAALALLAAAALRVAWVARPTAADPAAASCPFRAERLGAGPIVTAQMHPRLLRETERYGYVNVNGPVLIRVPDWVEAPLGRYYLYFAHHKGEFIRLAVADAVEGPWRIHGPGALELADSGFPSAGVGSGGLLASAAALWRTSRLTEFVALSQVGLAAMRARRARAAAGLESSRETRPHIASPEVVVDDARREIRLYYHGLLEGRVQLSRVAVSRDGVHFRAPSEPITAPYLRVFEWRGETFGLAMPGLLYRSADGLAGFALRARPLFDARVRHAAPLRRGATLYVFHTRVGDAPERILCAAVDLSPPDWRVWRVGPTTEILRPELAWEGAEEPVEPSLRGEIGVPVNQLRDPAVFDDEGRTYLLYAAAGERAIGLAELHESAVAGAPP